MKRPILVAGIPRSGTTWVADVLAQAGQASFLDEPDNHFRRPYALRAKLRMRKGEYPQLHPDESAPEYEILWGAALGSAPGQLGWPRALWRRLGFRLLARTRAEDVSAAIGGWSSASRRLRMVERLAVPERPHGHAEQVVAKSVYAPLALEWISRRFEPAIVVVVRHPLNVIASWRALGWLDRTHRDMLDELSPDARDDLAQLHGVPGPDERGSIARAAWLAGALSRSLELSAARNPNWHVVSHEWLCEEPHRRLSKLSLDLGLAWSHASDRHVASLDRAGEGFAINRVAKELPDAWRKRLTPSEAAEATALLDGFSFDA